MKKPIKKLLHNGEAYYAVSDAAKYLGTTPAKIRQMMGDGGLVWTQFRVNGRLFITAKSLSDKKVALSH